MKVTGIILDDGKDGACFGFLKQFPTVCAQADNIDALKVKLDRYLKIHLAMLLDSSTVSDSIRVAV